MSLVGHMISQPSMDISVHSNKTYQRTGRLLSDSLLWKYLITSEYIHDDIPLRAQTVSQKCYSLNTYPSVPLTSAADKTYLAYTAWANICSMHSCSRHSLIKLHHLLTLLKQPKERCQCTNIQCMSANSHNVVQNSSYLSKQCCNSVMVMHYHHLHSHFVNVDLQVTTMFTYTLYGSQFFTFHKTDFNAHILICGLFIDNASIQTMIS